MARAAEWTTTGRRGYRAAMEREHEAAGAIRRHFVVEERRISLQTEANNPVRLLDSGRVLC